MNEVEINTEYIKLNQLLKLAGIIMMGSETKMFVGKGLVKLNGTAVSELRKKIYAGDVLEVKGFEKIKIVKGLE